MKSMFLCYTLRMFALRVTTTNNCNFRYPSIDKFSIDSLEDSYTDISIVLEQQWSAEGPSLSLPALSFSASSR